MGKKRKITGPIDIHLNLNASLANFLREESEKDHRTFAEQIRYIITSYYMKGN